MKKSLLTGVALSALLAGPAMAADLRVKTPPPVYRPAPPVAVLYNWSGCYIGGHVGGLWAKKDWTFVGTGVSNGSHDADDWLAGVQAGCNYQVGAVVFGAQGDFAWTEASGSHTDLVFPTTTNHTEVRSLASVTGRIGYAWDRFLGYVKGGGAWERDRYDVFVTATGATVATARETRGGWTVGIGGEYAFTPNWTAFVEYNYYDFGTRQNNFVTPGGALYAIQDIGESKSVVKGGINFKFGWDGPAVRY
jgi:outer membrane immunogenic protein